MTQSNDDKSWKFNILGEEGLRRVRMRAQRALSDALADLIEWGISILAAEVTAAFTLLFCGSFAGRCALKIHVVIFVVGLIGFMVQRGLKIFIGIRKTWRESQRD